MSYENWIKYANHPAFITSCILFVFSICVCVIFIIRKNFPVNCWFCNTNGRVPFSNRNSWTCPNCQQYNGFTPEGDYNRPLYQNMQPSKKIMYNVNKFPWRESSNRLCHKCNINQQLKVMQLANFKPMNQKKFDDEVEQFESHLEEVYKLCKKCKRLVHTKLQHEKGGFLSPKKTLVVNGKKVPKLQKFKIFFIRVSLWMTYVLLIIMLISICLNANLFFSKNIIRLAKQHWKNILKIFDFSIGDKFLNTTESYRTMFNSSVTIVNHSIDLFHQYVASSDSIKYITHEEYRIIIIDKLVKSLTALLLVFNGILFSLELGKSFRLLLNLLFGLLSGYLTWTEERYFLILQPVILCLIIWMTEAILSNHLCKLNTSNSVSGSKVWKKMKNLSNSSTFSQNSDNDLMSEDSDFEDSPIDRNRTSTPDYMSNIQNNYSFNRSEITRPYGFQISSQPDQSFCNHSSYFKPYQQFSNQNCTTELDRGIGTLSLGSRTICPNNRSYSVCPTNHCFSPNFSTAATSPIMRRPVISPGKFVYSTQQSWVAGGYWGAESPKKVFASPDTSRSSSQSSGFESMASGNYRKSSALPPSLENISLKTTRKDLNYVPRNSSNFLIAPTSLAAKQTLSPNSTKIENFNLLKEYSFVAPNPNNSFIPLDKPRC